MAETLILYAFTELVLSLSPGPAVFLVLSQSIHKGFTSGLAVTFGVIVVNILYFALSALGVAAVLLAVPGLFLMLKYIGAAYLAWMGGTTLISVFEASKSGSPNLTDASEYEAKNIPRAFLKGLLMLASNVKNIVVFLAIIPQFIDPLKDAAGQFIALGTVSVLVEMPVLIIYAIIASRMAETVRSRGYSSYLDGLSGLVLIGIAGSLVASSHI